MESSFSSRPKKIPEGQDGTIASGSMESPENFGILCKNTVLATRLTVVVMDSSTQKPVKINPLRLTSPAEERWLEMAEIDKKRKKRAVETLLLRQPPTPEERLDTHDIYLQYFQYTNGRLPDNMVWMRDAKIESNSLVQPHDRNIHSNIFGDDQKRRAYEIAFANTTLFMESSATTLLSL
ncbi:hypothetical protein [Parasitella parasitica]|uniref:Uncharacterized protein n=1 Tax=Parasitella parasitica TaxID=35722 RepID=A0A0B7NJD1_9FUNG|nr:hypothetical protein [Parasitella parasitica]